MADIGLPSVNLTKFTTDMANALIQAMPNVELIEIGYRDSEPKDLPLADGLPTPAVLIKFIEIKPQTYVKEGVIYTKKQNNQMCVTLKFKAYTIIKASQINEGSEDQLLAASLASKINGLSRFGNPVGPAQVIDIKADGYFAVDNEICGKDSFIFWRVDWIHEALLGDIVTDGLCDDPDVSVADVREVYVGYDPNTGLKFKDDYVLVAKRADG